MKAAQLGLIAVLAAASFAVTGLVPTRAQTPPSALAQYGEATGLTEVAAAAAKCGWLDGFQQAVVLLSRDTEMVRIRATQGEAGASAARAGMDQARARGEAFVCDSGAAIQARTQSANIAYAHFALWLARAEAYESFSIREAWASDITTLKAGSDLVDFALRPFEAQPSYAAIKARAVQEAPVVLAAICSSRQTVRFVRGSRPCPPPADAVNTTMSLAYVEGAETVSRRHMEYQAEHTANAEYAKPFEAPFAGVFVATGTEHSRHSEIMNARIQGGFMFEGRIFRDEYELQTVLDDLLKAEFDCARPGRLIFDTASPSATDEQIGPVRGTGDSAMVNLRITAPVRRVGQPGLVTRVTATTLQHQELMSRVMARNAQDYTVEDWGGPSLGYTLLNCPG